MAAASGEGGTITYEALEKHHKQVTQHAAELGTEFPMLSEDKNRWLGEDHNIYDPNSPRSWSTKSVTEASILHERVRELMAVNSEALQLMQDEEGLVSYFWQMENASCILSEPVELYHASREGAKRYKGQHTVRYSLENIDGLSEEESQHYEASHFIPLDDGSPLTTDYSMSAEEHRTFFRNLQAAFDDLALKKRVLVHCSQGQSRSGIFVLLLVLALHVHGVLKLPGVADGLSNGDLLLQAVKFIAQKRKIISFSERWHPFIDFFASPSVRLTDLVKVSPLPTDPAIGHSLIFGDYHDHAMEKSQQLAQDLPPSDLQDDGIIVLRSQ